MHKITVGFIPVCTACGAELETGCCLSNLSLKPNAPFDRDNPHARTEQRVFVAACPKCFVYRGSAESHD